MLQVVPELAVIGDLVLGPGTLDDLESLLAHCLAIGVLGAKSDGLHLLGADTGAELDPPVREVIERGDVLSETHRVVERERPDHRAKTDDACLAPSLRASLRLRSFAGSGCSGARSGSTGDIRDPRPRVPGECASRTRRSGRLSYESLRPRTGPRLPSASRVPPSSQCDGVSCASRPRQAIDPVEAGTSTGHRTRVGHGLHVVMSPRCCRRRTRSCPRAPRSGAPSRARSKAAHASLRIRHAAGKIFSWDDVALEDKRGVS